MAPHRHDIELLRSRQMQKQFEIAATVGGTHAGKRLLLLPHQADVQVADRLERGSNNQSKANPPQPILTARRLRHGRGKTEEQCVRSESRHVLCTLVRMATADILAQFSNAGGSAVEVQHLAEMTSPAIKCDSAPSKWHMAPR